jgi:ATP-binding protein involved in chromosome partitioning
MSETLEDQVWATLKDVKFPGMSRDIVSFGFVDRVEVTDAAIRVDLAITTHNEEAARRVKQEVVSALADHQAEREVAVELKVLLPPSAAQQAVSQDPTLTPNVKQIVAVASGKGGVGKSTVSANLAIKLGQEGYRVGLLDADIYGPSMPMMFGINERPRVEGERLLPFEKFGIRLMSLGFILEVDTPVIWRGPMVMKALEQLLGDVEWGELDFMIIDLPPGTGDAQLTISQRVPLAGAVIVTTPQDVALIDARKGLAMFRKVNVPVIGIIENMSGFSCPHCGEMTHVFKEGGGKRTADLLECTFLGSVPLDPAVVLGGDSGTPIVVANPDGPHGEAFTQLARSVVAETSKREARKLAIF